MGDIWLIWSEDVAYRRIRREVKERYGARRIIRLHDVDGVVSLLAGLSSDRLFVAVGMNAEANGSSRAERMLRELSHANNVVELIACVSRLDAGVAARCFDAGATEVIAVGEAETSGDIRAGASTVERKCVLRAQSAGTHYSSPTCANNGEEAHVHENDPRVGMRGETGVYGEPAAQRKEGPSNHRESDECVYADYCDEFDGANDFWEEVPPWDEFVGEGWEPRGCMHEKACDTNRGGGDCSQGRQGWQTTEKSPDQTGCLSRDALEERSGAPMVTAISGRGGVGKTTLVTAMASFAAHVGLRAAVLDLDLMFGNAWELMGAEGFRGIEGVGLHADERGLAEHDIEDAAMRIGPGLTLWGPCERPEQAEYCSGSIERLVDVLREVADVIFVDTSGQWGDAVAMAVAKCDRCLVLGGPGTSLASSGKRAVSLATRLGVPHTRMTCVVNRFGAHDCNEEHALSFEMATALHSRVRIADGGDEVQNMLAFGKVNSLMEGSSAFAKDVRLLTTSLLQELGCPNAQWLLEEEHKRAGGDDRLRLRLPWKRRASDAL